MTQDTSGLSSGARAAAAVPADERLPIGERAAKSVAPTARTPRPRPVWVLLWLGITAQPWGVLAALLCTYTGIAPALLVASGAAVIGFIVGLITGPLAALMHGILPSSFVASGFSGGSTIVAAFVLAGAFALAGFLVVVGNQLVHPEVLLTSLVAGAVLTLGLTTIMILTERWRLRLTGFRRMSWEEATRVLPAFKKATTALGIDMRAAPPIMMSDQKQLGAWAYCSTIVVTTEMVAQCSEEEIEGILLHELHHWQNGHSVGLVLIFIAAFPLAVVYNIARRGRPNRYTFVTLAAVCVTWPTWAAAKIVAAVQTGQARAHEYAADAAALAAGAEAREGLKSALLKMGVFERGRTRWEEVIVATHPPMPLRIERLISLEDAQIRAVELRTWEAEWGPGVLR